MHLRMLMYVINFKIVEIRLQYKYHFVNNNYKEIKIKKKKGSGGAYRYQVLKSEIILEWDTWSMLASVCGA